MSKANNTISLLGTVHEFEKVPDGEITRCKNCNLHIRVTANKTRGIVMMDRGATIDPNHKGIPHVHCSYNALSKANMLK